MIVVDLKVIQIQPANVHQRWPSTSDRAEYLIFNGFSGGDSKFTRPHETQKMRVIETDATSF